MLKSTAVGNYPKLSADAGDVNIRRLLHKLDKGSITRDELERAMDEVTARVLSEQIRAGIDLPTDGQARWDDIVTPVAAASDGFEIGGLIRWFDNNVYYRKPQIIGPIKRREPIAVGNFTTARRLADREVKVILPGPLSLIELSDNRHYDDADKLMNDAVTLLRQEVAALIEAGATQIQFDEPSLQYLPERVDAAVAAVNEIVEGYSATFWLCFYFGRIKNIVNRLGEFRVQVVAVDCVSHPENFELLTHLNADKNVCFGLLEARNIKMEYLESLLRRYETISARFPDAYVSPSCGLEFLPHAAARQKVNLLGESVKRFNEGG